MERKAAAGAVAVFLSLSSRLYGFYFSAFFCLFVCCVCVNVVFVLYGDECVTPPLVTVILLDCVRNYCVIYCTRIACFE